MAAVGIPHDDMAIVIVNPRTNKPITGKTLRDKFRLELDRGMLKANVKVMGQMYRGATESTPMHPKGNPILQIFWAKCRMRWQQDPSKVPPPTTGDLTAPEATATLDAEIVTDNEFARRIAFTLEVAARKKQPA